MELFQKRPIVFSNVEKNNSTNFENGINNFLNEIQKNNNENLIPEADNFVYLLIQFAFWMKQYNSQISIELIGLNKFKIRIDNSIGQESIKYFSKLFEELTLANITLNYNDLKNEWFSLIKF